MLKAVVFDDEYIVLQGLRTMIDWRRFGVELAGTASDGLAALRMLLALKPDIVFSDIRMPGMDGLKLIETAARDLPDTTFVVFSGFTEFEYVKRAIGLGVVDYVDKPVTVPKIEDALLKALARIEKRQQLSALRDSWEAGREELLERAVMDLLLVGDKAAERCEELYGPDWKRIHGVTVLAFSDAQPPWRGHESYRVVNATNGDERLSVAFRYDLSEQDAWEERLLELAGEERNVFGSGRTYASVNDAPQSYREALRALRYGRFMGDIGRTRIEDVEGSARMPADRLKHEEAVIVSLRIGDEDGLTRALEGFEAWVEEQQLDPERTEQELLKLAYLGRSVMEEQAVDEGLAEKIRHRELSAMHTRGEMFRWLRQQLDALLAWKKASSRLPRHAAVNRALAYLEERYGQDVSLQDLAEHVGMNPTYLSLLFKEEMGATYIKHLTHIRMERAKEMLRDGFRVNEVSEKVGYLNYRHFTETFKKHVGVTPGQYREGYQVGKPG